MSFSRRVSAVEELLMSVRGRVSLMASLQDRQTTTALHGTGFVEQRDDPWFAQLWRSLDDLSDIDNLTNRTDYQIRPVAPGETAGRVRVHQRTWAPARIKEVLNLPVTGDEPQSSYTDAKHHLVTATPIYRSDLDIVAVAADGTLAAYGLGWLDPDNKSVLIEPVGTDPDHSGRGLAHAVCSQILKNAKALGATQAVVGPRGDPGYPIPGHIYRSLGMGEVAQFVPHAHD
jgi:GNAT superfamily N-acetyltransferase